MVATALIYSPVMAEYRFASPHPMRPERFTLAVDLMRAWDLLGEGQGRARVIVPSLASDADLLLVHSPEYVAAVKDGEPSATSDSAHGIGRGDTPRFADMHAVSALVAGGTVRALEGVIAGEFVRAFNPAGGLHHAHADRAAGFCVYNDCAVAMARVLAADPELRIAYVDIDAHHGDGVEEVFRARSEVLTVSIHESGRYLYPGTGASGDIGEGAGLGFAVNVPMPPHSGPVEYELAFERVVEPVLHAFAPDLIVAQLGADTYLGDPLTHLALTVRTHTALVSRLVRVADQLCAGRLVATGGGGYEAFSATPRMWACAMAALMGVHPPEELPASWLALSAQAARDHGAGPHVASRTFDEPTGTAPDVPAEETLRLARFAIERTRRSSPLLGTADL